MGYENHFAGAITITPPLTWTEIQDGPKLQDVQLRIREEKRTAVIDGVEAEVIVRTCDAIVPLDMEYSGHRLEEDIQAVIDHYGDRGYAGYIEARWDPGFGEPPSRFIVKDDRVMRIDAQYRWPGIWPEEPDDQPAAGRDGDVRAAARVWMYGTQEHSSEHAYTTLEAAQSEAIWEYDPTLAEYPEYWSWEPCPPQDGRLALLCGDDRTGYTVYPVTVVEQSIAALDARDADGSAS